MNEKLLGLKPKRYLCPYCGGWHDWPEDDEYRHALEWFDVASYLQCNSSKSGGWLGDYRIWFENGYFHYRVESFCSSTGPIWLKSKIAISDIVEDTERPIVTFEVPFSKFRSQINFDSCTSCVDSRVCAVHKQFDAGKKDFYIKFGFEFDEDDYKRLTATSTKAKVVKAQQLKEETTTMANNLFNLNIEFGMNTDENIASTLMGVAVRSDGNWRIYDKEKGEITDLGAIELSTLPLYIVPATSLTVGDLIKEDGEYYYVMEVAAGEVKSMHAGTGAIKTAVPVKNILGINCYSKVVSLIESDDLTGDMDAEKLLLVSAMSGQSGATNQMSQLALLLLLSDKMVDDDDMTNMLLMSTMMSDNSAVAANPLMGVMMLKMLDKKGKETTPPVPPQIPQSPMTTEQPDGEEVQPTE